MALLFSQKRHSQTELDKIGSDDDDDQQYLTLPACKLKRQPSSPDVYLTRARRLTNADYMNELLREERRRKSLEGNNLAESSAGDEKHQKEDFIRIPIPDYPLRDEKEEFKEVEITPKGPWATFRYLYNKFGGRHLFPVLLLIAYSFVGAAIFYSIEARPELKRIAKKVQNNTVEKLKFYAAVRQNVGYIESRRNIFAAFERYDKLFLMEPEQYKAKWTYKGSIFYCVSIYTTIGYGDVAPTTTGGKMATIIYALIGIPLVLAILGDLGSLLCRYMNRGWSRIVRAVKNRKRFEKAWFVSITEPHPDESALPASLAILITILWIFFWAALYLIWERNWSFIDSVYFFFISMTTIGLGDVMPKQISVLLMNFWQIFFGLCLVSMCINLAQHKIEEFLYRMLLALRKEYQKLMEHKEHISDKDKQRLLKKIWDKQPWFLRTTMPTVMGSKNMQILENTAEKVIERVTLEYVIQQTQTDESRLMPSLNTFAQTDPMLPAQRESRDQESAASVSLIDSPVKRKQIPELRLDSVDLDRDSAVSYTTAPLAPPPYDEIQLLKSRDFGTTAASDDVPVSGIKPALSDSISQTDVIDKRDQSTSPDQQRTGLQVSVKSDKWTAPDYQLLNRLKRDKMTMPDYLIENSFKIDKVTMPDLKIQNRDKSDRSVVTDTIYLKSLSQTDKAIDSKVEGEQEAGVQASVDVKGDTTQTDQSAFNMTSKQSQADQYALFDRKASTIVFEEKFVQTELELLSDLGVQTSLQDIYVAAAMAAEAATGDKSVQEFGVQTSLPDVYVAAMMAESGVGMEDDFDDEDEDEEDDEDEEEDYEEDEEMEDLSAEWEAIQSLGGLTEEELKDDIADKIKRKMSIVAEADEDNAEREGSTEDSSYRLLDSRNWSKATTGTTNSMESSAGYVFNTEDTAVQATPLTHEKSIQTLGSVGQFFRKHLKLDWRASKQDLQCPEYDDVEVQTNVSGHCETCTVPVQTDVSYLKMAKRLLQLSRNRAASLRVVSARNGQRRKSGDSKRGGLLKKQSTRRRRSTSRDTKASTPSTPPPTPTSPVSHVVLPNTVNPKSSIGDRAAMYLQKATVPRTRRNYR